MPGVQEPHRPFWLVTQRTLDRPGASGEEIARQRSARAASSSSPGRARGPAPPCGPAGPACRRPAASPRRRTARPGPSRRYGRRRGGRRWSGAGDGCGSPAPGRRRREARLSFFEVMDPTLGAARTAVHPHRRAGDNRGRARGQVSVDPQAGGQRKRRSARCSGQSPASSTGSSPARPQAPAPVSPPCPQPRPQAAGTDRPEVVDSPVCAARTVSRIATPALGSVPARGRQAPAPGSGVSTVRGPLARPAPRRADSVASVTSGPFTLRSGVWWAAHPDPRGR